MFSALQMDALAGELAIFTGIYPFQMATENRYLT